MQVSVTSMVSMTVITFLIRTRQKNYELISVSFMKYFIVHVAIILLQITLAHMMNGIELIFLERAFENYCGMAYYRQKKLCVLNQLGLRCKGFSQKGGMRKSKLYLLSERQSKVFSHVIWSEIYLVGMSGRSHEQ